MVHPECPGEVVAMADFVGSTKAIIDYAASLEGGEFIVGTEKGVLHPLSCDKNAEKKLYHLLSEELICEDMKITTLESVYRCLKDETHEMILEKDVIENAAKALNEMLRLAEK
jgi:quinolinate synthase